MDRGALLRRVVVLAALGACYVVAGKLGLRLAFVHASATAVWPPAGIALAALLILGARAWPAIFAGAFLVNVTTAGSIATSIGIAAGNTLEGLTGSCLVRRFAGGDRPFERAQDVFRFALFAALLSTTVSATFGVLSLAVGGFARWIDAGYIWTTWWLGDAAGDLIVAPVALLWAARARLDWSRAQAVEAGAVVLCLLLTGQAVFGGWLPVQAKDYPLEFVCVPVLLWAGLRFGQREAATAVLLLSILALWGTLRGFGPFARQTHNESLVLLQAFMAVMSVTALTLAAVVADRKRVEERLRHLSVTDPLTGLANYRHLIGVLEAETHRAKRTKRTFALLLFDVDRLKKINDRHGHLVGSRALCRLANVLRESCRDMDTAARFGGDEFALVLPEADEQAAWGVAQRICERLAADSESPRVTVSVGVGVYPRHGGTADGILAAADRALYGMKGNTRRRSRA